MKVSRVLIDDGDERLIVPVFSDAGYFHIKEEDPGSLVIQSHPENDPFVFRWLKPFTVNNHICFTALKCTDRDSPADDHQVARSGWRYQGHLIVPLADGDDPRKIF